MLLAIDVGNTHTVIGAYSSSDGENPKTSLRIATDKTNTADDLRGRVVPLLREEGIELSATDHAALASVVPSLAHAWVRMLNGHVGMNVSLCSAGAASAAGLFEADYPNVGEIGADRIADAIGAREIYGAPVIVLDFGTATNIEIIDDRGMFVGGIIAPGVESSASALFSRATKLATIDLVAPERVIGTSTETAVQSGIVFGEAGRVDGLVERIFDQLGYRAPVVATGGLASLVGNQARTVTSIDPDLTIKGLRVFAQRCCGAS